MKRAHASYVLVKIWKEFYHFKFWPALLHALVYFSNLNVRIWTHTREWILCVCGVDVGEGIGG